MKNVIQQRQVATAAPAPLVLEDGTTYYMSPLTDLDIAELDQWVQQRCIKIARDSIPSDADEEERARIESYALDKALQLTWMSGPGAGIIATVDGMARLVWQSIRARHPEVTLADLKAKMFNAANIESARQVFVKVNPVEEGPKKRAPNEERQKRRKAKLQRRRKRLRRKQKSIGR